VAALEERGLGLRGPPSPQPGLLVVEPGEGSEAERVEDVDEHVL
jgi:hypothetical protein